MVSKGRCNEKKSLIRKMINLAPRTAQTACMNDNWDFKIQRRDGDKNVAWKLNLRSFSLYSDYSYPLTLSMVGEPSWSWISRDHIHAQKEK